MLYHLISTPHPLLVMGALSVSVLFVGILSIKERKHDPERA